MHVERKMRFDHTLSWLKKLYNKINYVVPTERMRSHFPHFMRLEHCTSFNTPYSDLNQCVWLESEDPFIYWSHKVLLKIIFRAESFVTGFWLYANYFLRLYNPPTAPASTALSLELFLCSGQLFAARKISHPENTKLIAFPIRKWRQSCSQTQFKNLREKKESILVWNEAQWKASINNMNIITGMNHAVKDKQNHRKVLASSFH